MFVVLFFGISGLWMYFVQPNSRLLLCLNVKFYDGLSPASEFSRGVASFQQ